MPRENVSGIRPSPIDSGLELGVRPDKARVTISGSFRQHLAEVEADIRAFTDLGAEVLSPLGPAVRRSRRGFVELDRDPSTDPRTTEDRHLEAIRNSSLLWLTNPSGYAGLSAAFEQGFATALGIPVLARETPQDSNLAFYARRVGTPREALKHRIRASMSTTMLLDPNKALESLRRDLAELSRLFSGLEGPMDSTASKRARAAAVRMKRTLGNLAME